MFEFISFFKKNTLENVLIQAVCELGVSIVLGFMFVGSFGMNSPLTLLMILLIGILVVKVITLAIVDIAETIERNKK